MTKLAFTFLATVAFATPLLTTPVLAESPARQIAFERDGVSFVGQITDMADGSQMLVGRDAHSGMSYDLRVAGGQVTGTVGGTPVSYAVPRRKAGNVPVVAFREQ